jgi:hypothetical protein
MHFRAGSLFGSGKGGSESRVCQVPQQDILAATEDGSCRSRSIFTETDLEGRGGAGALSHRSMIPPSQGLNARTVESLHPRVFGPLS